MAPAIFAATLAAQNSGAARDAWQRPAAVMDELDIRQGSVVADVGCGRGYFTFHFAERVGPGGKVYAEDVRDDRLKEVRRQAEKEGISQVQTLLGAEDDPKLPRESLDAVFVMDAYHEMHQYDAMLQGIYRALKPGGLLALIDGTAEPGQPRSEYYEGHRMPKEVEREDATRNGFHFLREPKGFVRSGDKKEFYFLIFEKPKI